MKTQAMPSTEQLPEQSTAHAVEAASPVYAYLRNPSMVDFEGHLAAVFFTTGCNFKCGFCHNAALMGRQQKGLSWSRVRQACETFRGEWVDAAVISGGEPTLSPDLLPLIHTFKDLGWAIKLDTNGSNPAVLDACLPHVDYVAMDIKTAPSAYHALAGYEPTDNLRRSVDLIRERASDYEFRTTILPDHHDETVMDEIAHWLDGSRRYIIQPFLPSENLPDPALRQGARTSHTHLATLYERVRHVAEDVRIRGDN